MTVTAQALQDIMEV